MGYDEINRLYQQHLGRSASEDEANNWLSGAYGATDPAGIAAQIQQSGEAQDYRGRSGGAAGGGGTGGGGSAGGWGSGMGVGEAGGGGGPWSGGGNTWGAGTTSSPFGPWQGQYTAPAASPLPAVPTWDPATVPGAPSFTAPGYTPPPAFSYADFQAPSYADAASDPGYQFRLQQGNQLLQNAASAKGTLNDSGTLKALTDYGQGAASQEYANVWNRALGAYTTNRGNAAQNYTTNYQTQYQDPYAHAYQAAQDQFAPRMAQYQAQVAAGRDANQAALLGYQTTAQNVQHQNDLANTNAWNDYLLGWQDYEARRGQGINFALGS
jgi:hypothetical protein